MRATGAEPVLADIEALDDVAEFVDGADAVVFAAGAGPGSGAERKRTVDLGAAVKLLDGARRDRRAALSDDQRDGRRPTPRPAAEAMRPYLEAKAQADAALAASDLDWTIVRPGGLTDEPGTGRVEVARLARPPRLDHPRRRRGRARRLPRRAAHGARDVRPAAGRDADRAGARGAVALGVRAAPVRSSRARVAHGSRTSSQRAAQGRARPAVRRRALVQARSCSWSCVSRTSCSSSGPSCASPRA